MPFRPNPEDMITIADITYTFTEHPAAPGMAYGQTGRRGTVYQLQDQDGGLWALKVFLRQYREPRLVGQAERIRSYAALPGLQACERRVLTASRDASLLRDEPDLTYAVLMPWVIGSTWLERVLGGELLTLEQSLGLARALASVLVGMEERGLAHCDLSGPNLILTPEGGIELVDLEEMCGPELMKPEQLPGGSPGYAHRTAPHGLWNTRADRFAGAVLLAEMLGFADDRVAAAKWGEGYFAPEQMGENSERYRLLKETVVETYGTRPGDLLDSVWFSDTLAGCPTFSEWLVGLPDEVPVQQTPLTVSLEDDGSREGDQDPGMLVLNGEAFVREGQLDLALEALYMASELSEGPLKARIAARISELERASESSDAYRVPPEDRTAVDASTSTAEPSSASAGGWTCQVCGRQAAEADPVCPYCEQGTRLSSLDSRGSVPLRKETTAPDRSEDYRPGGKPSIPRWIWLLVGGSVLMGLIGFCRPAPEPETVIELVEVTAVPREEPVEEPLQPDTEPAAAWDGSTIIWGVIQYSDDEYFETGTTEVEAHLIEDTGVDVEFRGYADLDTLFVGLAAGEIGMTTLGPFEYLMFEAKGVDLEPALVSMRYGASAWNSQILALAESGIYDFRDMTGKVFCIADHRSWASWGMPLLALRAAGLDPASDMTIVDAGGHPNVVDAVYNGACSAGGTYVDARTTLEEDYPDVMDVVQVIDVSVDVPNQGVQYAPAVPEEVQAQITQALLDLSAREEGQEMLDYSSIPNNGMIVVDDSYYDPLRALLESADTTPVQFYQEIFGQ